MIKHFFTIVVAVVIAASLLFYLFSFQVRENENAVVLTFGKADEASVKEAGLHAQWPWPIQEVRKFDTRLRVYESEFEEVPTRGQVNIIVSVCVAWRINDPIRFNREFGGVEEKAETQSAQAELKRIVRHEVNAAMGSAAIGDLVSLDVTKLKHAAIEAATQTAATKEAKKSYGIEVALVKIRRIELPESVKSAVYDRMREERNAERSKIESSGKEKAARITRNAQAEAEEIKKRAEARAKSIRTEGERLASAHYEAFRDFPELAIYLKEVETFKQIAENRTTLVLDPRSPAVRVLVDPPPSMEKAGK